MSIESLNKINEEIVYNCVIMDESEANLNVFSSSTMNSRQIEVFDTLCRLIKSSKKTVFAGAFLTDKTFDFAKSFDEPTRLIRNWTKPPQREAKEINNVRFNVELYDSIKKGDKNYVCWASATAMGKFDGELDNLVADPRFKLIQENPQNHGVAWPAGVCAVVKLNMAVAYMYI